MEIFVQEWQVLLPPLQMRVFQICPILVFLAVFLTTPIILIQIPLQAHLRQQTRYLLLANALLSDLLFVALYMLTTCLNAATVLMSDLACSAMLFLMDSKPHQVCMFLTVTTVLIILLLASGYVILYCHTSKSGVWRGERSSRARGTFLVHYLHLFLSVCPMLLLVIELLLYSYSSELHPSAGLWVSLVPCNILLVLPKALAPYLYGLRYRDLRGVLLDFFRLNRPRAITPVM